jgi:DHA2 family multidrug resistance protein
VVNGIGISFIFIPLTTSTVAYLRQDQMGNATGLYNLMRNIGGSLGIAFVTTMLARDAQVHQAMMVAHTTPYDPAFMQQLASAKSALIAHSDPVAAMKQAYQLVYGKVLQQSSLWAFVDNFRLFGLLCLACLPLVFRFKKRRQLTGGGVDIH